MTTRALRLASPSPSSAPLSVADLSKTKGHQVISWFELSGNAQRLIVQRPSRDSVTCFSSAREVFPVRNRHFDSKPSAEGSELASIVIPQRY
jgi:hypothetical protein